MAESSWRDELARTITDVAGLPDYLTLTDDERRFFDAPPEAHGPLALKVPLAVVRRMVEAARRAGGQVLSTDPLRRQFIPTAAELETQPYELADPLGEERYSPVPRLIHRYPDRALLLVTDQCVVHCRYCFRSRFTGGSHGGISRDELRAVESYLAAHTEIRELILSGGDALMLGDGALADVLDAARHARPDIVFRVATRIPVVMPGRVTAELARLLRARAPLWVVVQANHPDELHAEASQALSVLADAGIPVINQTVLLAGVNDDAKTLDELFTALVRLRVKPYYLFQADLAPGTSHFRVNVERALWIVAELRRRLSGLAMPVFAVDIPGGAGKVPLEPSALIGEDESGYRLRAADGHVHHYPKEEG
ncbi:MAG: KamA family radical SAM protein [Spirochaetales bacterium]|nr:KamA family radical SAM protein [Spirochaetales bacterium]